jgi:hypothetical protein
VGPSIVADVNELIPWRAWDVIEVTELGITIFDIPLRLIKA